MNDRQMKYKILLTILILTSLNAWGQKKGIVHYGQIESKTLKAPLGPDFNAFLLFDNDASYYVTRNDSLEGGKEFKKVYRNEDEQTILSFWGPLTFQHGNQVYHNRKKDSIYWSQWVRFYVAEKTPKIDWKLENETKKSGNSLPTRPQDSLGVASIRLGMSWTYRCPMVHGNS